MKSFMDLARERYSVRVFKADPVEEEKIAQILEATQVAPTACNYHSQKIYAVRSEENLKKLAALSPCTFKAPLVFMVGYDSALEATSPKTGVRYGVQDASITGTHMMLAAQDLGLGTCWVGYFDPEAVRKAFDLPESVRIVALLPTGYPAENAVPSQLHTTKRPQEEMVEYL